MTISRVPMVHQPIDPKKTPKEWHDLKVGMAVKHSVFGRGSVVRFEHTRLGTAVRIKFDIHGDKELQFEFCKKRLEIL